MATRKFLFMATEGYYEEQQPGDDISLGKATFLGDGGVAIDAGNNKIVNLADPTASTDAATKNYVDATAQGLQVKDPVEVVAKANVPTLSGLLTIDTDVLVDGNRVLLTAQTSGVDDGIWVAHSGAWTRAADLATGSSAHGVFVVVLDGTQAGTGWVCTNAPGSAVVGTDSLVFKQMSGAQDITASTGLVRVGNDIQVKPGDGIEVTSNSGSTNVALDTNSGLALNGTAGSKLLAFFPDLTQGLAKSGSGAYVKLQPNHGLHFNAGNVDLNLLGSGGLQADASGLSVKLADGSLSSGSSGLSVNFAAYTISTMTAAIDIAAGNVVYWSSDNAISPASSSSDAASHVIGVATGAIGTGTAGPIVTSGRAAGVLSGATVNTNYYLSATGTLTTTVPSGKRNMLIGRAMNTTDLWVEIIDYGKKA